MGSGEIKVYGRHACRAVFESRPDDVLRAWVAEEAVGDMGDLLRGLARRRRPYKVVPPAELERVAGAKHHEGICLLTVDPPQPTLREVLGRVPKGAAARLVYLDGIANPHNLGAILRVCAHFGVAAVLGRRGELAPLSGAARRVAEGGAEHVPVVILDEPEAALRELASAGFVVVGTGADAPTDLFEAELPPRCVFLLGAERTGLSDRLRRLCALAVAVSGTGAVESLNVSTASAVLLAEHWHRHRGDS